jgi:aldose 1-epimerase
MNLINQTQSIAITKTLFGVHQHQEIFLYTLKNKNGHEIKISNYGATITAWLSKDKQGQTSNIIFGFNELENYTLHPNYHFGGIIGRFANRIGGGQFVLDGTIYNLEKNNGTHHIHGGIKGFDQMVWDADIVEQENRTCLVLKYFSKEGEEGYPGNLNLQVSYSLDDYNELKIEYRASTDKATHINFTNHAYFNLCGDFKQSILNHQLQILADHYLPSDETALPTGEIKSVKNSAFNFLHAKFINADLAKESEGYDHNYVLNKKDHGFALAAIVKEQSTGRLLEVHTTEPGLQLYTGNFLDGKVKNEANVSIHKHCGLCLETQHFPNSPNQAHFPSTLLNPNTDYHSVTSYKLSLA